MVAGITTRSPRIDVDVATPSNPPLVLRNAPPAKPSCIGAVVRITWSMARRGPVGNGPPMTDTIPELAVTTLLQDRATAMARLPTRAGACARLIAFALRPGTRSTARLV